MYLEIPHKGRGRIRIGLHDVYSYPVLVFLLLERVTLFGLCKTTNALLEDSNAALVFFVWTVLEPED